MSSGPHGPIFYVYEIAVSFGRVNIYLKRKGIDVATVELERTSLQ